MRARALLKRNLADVLIVAIGVAALIELSVSVVPGSKLLLALVVVSALGALLLRRRFPFGGPLAATAVLAAGSFFVGDGLRVLAVPVLAAILAGWLMGYGNPRRRAILGLFLQYVCVQITTAHFDQPGAGDIVFTSLLIGAPVARRPHRPRARRGRAGARAANAGARARPRGGRASGGRRRAPPDRARAARRRRPLDQRDDDPGRRRAAAPRREPRAGRGAAAARRGDRPRDALRDAPAARRAPPRHGAPGAARGAAVARARRLAASSSTARPACRSISSSKADERTLPQGLDLAAYRVVQEALTNTLKHAAGATAAVEIAYRRESLDSRLGHAAAAPAPARRSPRSASGGGHGLVGMRERAEIYGGRLEAGPRGGRRVPRLGAVPARAGRPVTTRGALVRRHWGDAARRRSRSSAASRSSSGTSRWGQSDDAIDLDDASRGSRSRSSRSGRCRCSFGGAPASIAGLAVFIAVAALGVIDADATDSVVLFVMILAASAAIGLHEDRRRAIVGG